MHVQWFSHVWLFATSTGCSPPGSSVHGIKLESPASPALAGRFFTTEPHGNPSHWIQQAVLFWCPCWPWGKCPPRVNRFPRTVYSPKSTPLTSRLTSPNPSPIPFCLGILSYGTPSLCPNHPRARHQTSRGNPYTLSPPKLFNLAIPKLLTLPHPFLPTENTSEGFSVSPLLSLFFLTDPGASSCGPTWPDMISSQELWALSQLFSGSCLRSCEPPNGMWSEVKDNTSRADP